MGGERAFLSIVIPTYNRKDALARTIDSVLGQESFGGGVELLVSDNCSTDGTEELVRRRYLAEGKRITYIRRRENIGPDNNFREAIADASGEYVKLLNDNRPMRPGSLGRILSLLERERPSVLLTPNGSGSIPAGCSSTASVDEFVLAASYFTTWLGSICLEKALWESIPDKDRGKGKYLIQTCFLYDVLAQRPSAVVCNERLFDKLPSPYEAGGYNLFQVFLANYLEILDGLVRGGLLSPRVFRVERRRLLTRFMVPSIVKLIERPEGFSYDRRGWAGIALRLYWTVPAFYASPFLVAYKLLKRRARALLKPSARRPEEEEAPIRVE